MFKNNEDSAFACFIFSLMLNSNTLEKLTSIFKKVCNFYNSKDTSDDCNKASDSIVHKIEKRKLFVDTDFEDEAYEAKFYASNDKKLTNSVFKNSKFRLHFEEVESSITILDNGASTNENYKTEFIQYLQKYFMPYCFLWSGLVLYGLNVSRVDNGSIDKHFGHKKSKITSPLLPAEYKNHTFKPTLGQVAEFMQKSLMVIKLRATTMKMTTIILMIFVKYPIHKPKKVEKA
jgi:hypothetical protein